MSVMCKHVESCHDISDHFTSVELGLECVKVVPELKPWWKHVILDPPNSIVVTGQSPCGTIPSVDQQNVVKIRLNP